MRKYIIHLSKDNIELETIANKDRAKFLSFLSDRKRFDFKIINMTKRDMLEEHVREQDLFINLTH